MYWQWWLGKQWTKDKILRITTWTAIQYIHPNQCHGMYRDDTTLWHYGHHNRGNGQLGWPRAATNDEKHDASQPGFTPSHGRHWLFWQIPKKGWRSRYLLSDGSKDPDTDNQHNTEWHTNWEACGTNHSRPVEWQAPGLHRWTSKCFHGHDDAQKCSGRCGLYWNNY